MERVQWKVAFNFLYVFEREMENSGLKALETLVAWTQIQSFFPVKTIQW